MEELEKQAPVTLEQVEGMKTDYDTDLDLSWGETPTDYPCEDDSLPIYVAEADEAPRDQAST